MSKKFSFLIITVVLCLVGCSSVPKAESAQSSSPSVPKSESKKTESKAKKELFEDWKYKGFGVELPAWVEPAYKKDSKTVKKFVPEFTDGDLVIGGFAVNGDQAEKLIETNKNLEGYTYYGSYWAKINQEVEKTELPYVYLLIFLKKGE